ncbi:MAG: slipin family protein [Flavobacterium sp.]|uniref:slipin family protein n=1 Tax=Flavobacterium sp. TaxID=239 RepID=UPI0011F9613C|nr:slipin family protein [Flavobacterium sp.]RZJ65319.1 MAG: slipin family protein [Flavobacterium sp.]
MITNYYVKPNHVALVFMNGKLHEVLTEGKYWVGFNKKIELYDMSAGFHSVVELNILLQNQAFASAVDVVEVKDGEIALQFTNGNFKDVLAAGRHVFWKGANENTFVKADVSKVTIDENISTTILDMPKVRGLVRKFYVATDETGLLYVDAKFVKQLQAGTYYFWANQTSVEIKSVDLRSRFLEIAGQELLTKDKAALRINFFVQFKVIDAVKAVSENKEYEKQLYVLMQLALRESVGTVTLDELLSRKDSLGSEIVTDVVQKTADMGIAVSEAGIRDIILPGDMKDIMNQVLVAEKKAQANSIMRREETASTRSLLNTAKLMEENAMLFKLKEMEYVEKIAEKINTISVSGGGQIVDQLKQIFTK